MTCTHLNTRLDSNNLANATICPDCGKSLRIHQLVNNMLDAMQDAIKIERPRKAKAKVDEAPPPDAGE